MDASSSHGAEKSLKKNHSKDIQSRSPSGRPYESLTSCLTVGPRGPALLQDTCCIELLQNFVRKNIPPRIAHDNGMGVHGFFELTNPNIKQYSKACIFQELGKKIDLFCRFTTTPDSRRAHNSRDIWTMSLKMYTEDGNQDLLCINMPVFHNSDPADFINFNVVGFLNPETSTGFGYPESILDNNIHSPASNHFTLFFTSSRFMPFSFRHINAFPINIFKLVNSKNEWVYARFQFKTNQGVQTLSNEQASIIRKTDPDFPVRDLTNAVATGNYPSFTWYVQIMEPEEPANYFRRTGWSAFDLTKVWPQSQYPSIEIGRIVLNRNIDNFFNETVQSAFTPANLIPGIGAAPEDRVFAGRIFAYEDAQMYRLGGNKATLPINRPKNLKTPLHSYYNKCPMNFTAGGDMSNFYFPNSFGGPMGDGSKRQREDQVFEGVLDHIDLSHHDCFSQSKIFYEKVIDDDERNIIATNIALITSITNPNTHNAVIKHWANVSEDLATRVAKILAEILK